MKRVKIYVIHKAIKSVNDFVIEFGLQKIEDMFILEWDEDSPDVLIATDHIYSHFKTFNKLFIKLYHKAKIKVFIATEALYPDFNIFDYAIGWDKGIVYERYCQMPPTFIYPARKFTRIKENPITSIDEAKEVLKKKTRFCNFLYSNWKAHPMRDNLFYAINKYKKVDSLGKHLNNVEKKGTGYIGHRKESIDLKIPYKFSIACENAFHNGYTSEKIITSFNALTIPIYWGDPNIIDRFNPKAFVNVFDFNNIDEMVKEIKKIDTDDYTWCDYISQPWQTNEQIKEDKIRFSNYISFWEKIFSNTNISMCPAGTMPDLYYYWFLHRNKSKLTKYYESLNHKLFSIKHTL